MVQEFHRIVVMQESVNLLIIEKKISRDEGFGVQRLYWLFDRCNAHQILLLFLAKKLRFLHLISFRFFNNQSKLRIFGFKQDEKINWKEVSWFYKNYCDTHPEVKLFPHISGHLTLTDISHWQMEEYFQLLMTHVYSKCIFDSDFF